MRYSFFVTDEFEKQYKRLKKKYKSLPDDIKLFKENFSKIGFVDLGNGFKKHRLCIKSKGGGKRGGARLISLDLLIQDEETNILLVCIYDKSEIPNVSETYIDSIVKGYIKNK